MNCTSFPIVDGADSPLPVGDTPGGARLPRRDDFKIAGGASSSRPAGDDAAACRGTPGGDLASSRPGLLSIHITPAAASLLALLAAEHGESPGGTVARLVVA